VYFYDIKIQTDINQNGVQKYAEKSQFLKIFFLKWNWVGPGPIMWAGPISAQLQGWTQPSRVGWADVPAQNEQKGGLLVTVLSTVTSEL
jgi:hypothetical protein